MGIVYTLRDLLGRIPSEERIDAINDNVCVIKELSQNSFSSNYDYLNEAVKRMNSIIRHVRKLRKQGYKLEPEFMANLKESHDNIYLSSEGYDRAWIDELKL